MATPKHILIIIRRSNGDVLLASPLLQHLAAHYPGASIELLVNDDTLGIAKALQPVQRIHVYSYQWKKLPLGQRLRQQIALIRQLWQRYDLAISLTTTDSSVLYARLFGRQAISAVDAEPRKSGWKKQLLTGYYTLDPHQHVVLNNLQALRPLGIPLSTVECQVHYTPQAKAAMLEKLRAHGIERFIIFHPSAQYGYKIYPENLRHQLLAHLHRLGLAIVVTGASTALDHHIKAALPTLARVYDFIGATSLDEYIALSDLALAYVGGDTLNMHIAAAQNKRIFAIFGPTLLPLWSPWSNALQRAATVSQAAQTYGNITVFQATLPCVPCGQAGCNNQHGDSECLTQIDPGRIAAAVRDWLSLTQPDRPHDQD